MKRQRNKEKKIEITGRKVGSADEFQSSDVDQEEGVEHTLVGKSMKYPPTKNPTEPGFYWLAEQDMPIHVVELCIESDSHDMYYVLLPDDDYKYDPGMWPGALWFGPLDEADRKAAQSYGSLDNKAV